MAGLSDKDVTDIAAAALKHSNAQDAKRYRAEPGAGDWYIVRSVGKTDQHALDWLKRFNVETYYPKTIQLRPVARKFLSSSQRRSGMEILRPAISPLFPRYIFARLDLGRHGWHEIFRTAAIGGMVCDGNLPVLINETLFAKIKGREVDGAIQATVTTRALFEIGDEVEVTDGPFAGFPGIVERGLDSAITELAPDDRIKVAVTLFGRAVPVELDVWQVSKQR